MKMKEIHRSFTLSSQNGANFAGEKTKTRSLKEINSIYYITMSYLRFTKMFLLILACVMGGLSANAQKTVEDLINQEFLPVHSSYKDYKFDKGESGASYTLNYFKQKGKQFFQINYRKKDGQASGIVTTQYNGSNIVKQISIEWNKDNTIATLEIYGKDTPYTSISELYNKKSRGEKIGELNANTLTCTVSPKYKFIGMLPTGNMHINSITITWEGSGTPGEVTVANPVLSEQSQTITAPIDVEITTATPDAKIYYTVDGTTPSTTNGTLYSNPVHVDKSLTLKAIAVLGDKTSDVVEATYTLSTIKNDGSFEKPYTPAEFIKVNPQENVWVKGTILGKVESNGNGFVLESTDKNNYSVCIGESGKLNCMGIRIEDKNALRALNLHTLRDKKLMVLGHSTAKDYYGRPGIREPQLFFIDGDDALAKMEVATKEGYSTFYNANSVQVPAGVQCGIVTGVKNGVMTIDYKYQAGEKIPANTPVIVKAEGIQTYPLAISTSDAQDTTTNLLKGADKDGEFTAEPNYYYYKLAYDNFTAKTGLGFYWGEANGGAFKMKAGKAYLAVKQDVAQGAQKFSLEGNATGIEAVEQANEANRVVYTLDGRRVMNEKLAKGLYIINGKKVLVK